jgi:hypothetical protein
MGIPSASFDNVSGYKRARYRLVLDRFVKLGLKSCADPSKPTANNGCLIAKTFVFRRVGKAAVPCCKADVPSQWIRECARYSSAGSSQRRRVRRSPARRLTRHDVQKWLRPDRDLTGEWPIMSNDQQHRGGHSGREQPHRNPRCQPIAAVNDGDHQQLAYRLQV